MEIDNPHAVFRKYDMLENPSLTTEIGRVSQQPTNVEGMPKF